MEHKFTKGQWTVLNGSEIISEHHRQPIATINKNNNWTTHAEDVGNANLIAAAPDLLAALINLMEEGHIHQCSYPALSMAKQAIERATK